MDLQAVFDSLAKFAQDVLVAALPIVLALALRWVKAEAERLKLTQLITQYAPLVVKAAEGLHLAEAVQDKKAYAVERLQAILLERGVKVEVGLVADAVEAAVLDEFNWHKAEKYKPAPTPAQA